MPNLNPRVIGDLPYPNRSATTNALLDVGGLASAPVTTPGSGYTIGEQVTITPPPSGGIQAVAEIETLDNNGGILTLKITNQGAGYLQASVPVITDPVPTTGTGAVYGTTTVQLITPVFLGRIYTAGSGGELKIPSVVSSDAILLGGVMQARATTVTGDGNTRVQVITAPSRILLKAKAGIHVNDAVDLETPTPTTVDQEKAKLGSSAFKEGHLGRVFEIETKNADGTKKDSTADNDLVVIDLGVT